MTKPDSQDAPEAQSRENAISSRKVEPGAASMDLSLGEAVALNARTAATEAVAASIEAGIVSHAKGSGEQTGDALSRTTGSSSAAQLDELPPPGEPASHANPHNLTPAEKKAADEHDRLGDIVMDRETGNVPSPPAVEPPATGSGLPAKELATAVMSRLRREKRWFGQVEEIRDQMMRESKSSIPDKEARQLWVYGELDRMYPPLEKPIQIGKSESGETDLNRKVPPGETDLNRNLGDDQGQIQGLAELPKGWPELPSNASLADEIGWVQANRLRIVDERPGRKTLVSMSKALTPAPSWSAIGWLETSIRSYAKFVDVAAKISSADSDETYVTKRERKSIEEVRALLSEMMAAEGTCPHCGRAY